MEHKANTNIPISINDVKIQNVPQNAALLLAKLQQKVARLEITLRDKEAEIAKLNSSCKASYVNELKIQTEIYYQEVFRLKNQLNKLQENPVQCSPNQVTKRHNLRKNFKASSDEEEDEEHSPSPPPVHNVDKDLLQSIEKLKEENERLSNQLTSIQEDKAKLAAQYENLVRQLKDQKDNKVSLSENMTQTSPRIESSPPSPKIEISDESLNILKFQIEELQNKEKVWEEERGTYKELVLNLKEDRIFFKDTSQKRNDELWSLQKELIKLQKEIGGLQLNGKPICKQCTKPSYRTTKLTKKIVVKDMGTVTTPRHSSKGSGSTSVTSSSSSDKNSSKTNAAVASGSPKRLPTPIKSLKKETVSRSSSSNVVSKSVSSSTPPSSGSDSVQPSPSHREKTINESPVKCSPKNDGSSSSPSKCCPTTKAKQSPVSPCSSPARRRSSTLLSSPSLSPRKGTPPTGTVNNVSPSKKDSPGNSPTSGNVSPAKKGSSSHSPTSSNVSPVKKDSSSHSPTGSNASPAKKDSSSHSPTGNNASPVKNDSFSHSPTGSNVSPAKKNSSSHSPSGSNVSPTKKDFSSHSSTGSNVSPVKKDSSSHSLTGGNVSPVKKNSSSSSPLNSPLRGKKPEEMHQEKENQNSRSSFSSDSSTNTSPRSKLIKKLEKIKEYEDDEIIAVEILNGLNSVNLEESSMCTNEERRNSTILSSSKPSIEDDTDHRVPSIDDPSVTQNEYEDNEDVPQDTLEDVPQDSAEDGLEDTSEEPYYEKVSEKSLKLLFCLFESHENRKKKVQELKTNLTKNVSSKMDSPKSVSNRRKKPSLTKSKSSSSESRHSSSPSIGRSPSHTVAKGPHVKGSPQKVKRTESKSEREFKIPPGEEGENMKDIDRMIGLLEGHIARKAFLILCSQNSENEDSQQEIT